jgi:hypothetical protein
MYRTLLFVPLFSFFMACKKKDSPAVTYTVKYECKCTPLLGATLSGTITYTTPTSANNTGTLTNNNWTFTQTQWALKTGDRINVSSTVQGNSDCTLYIYVDGAIKTFRNQAVQISGQTPTNSISLEYIAP